MICEKGNVLLDCNGVDLFGVGSFVVVGIVC